MVQAGAAVTARIDGLQRVLTCEVHIVSCLAEVGWAQHAHVPICNVKTAGIAHVLVGMLLNQNWNKAAPGPVVAHHVLG